MSAPTDLAWLARRRLQDLWEDLRRTQAFWEDLMELPPCPLCKEGRLLPLSDENEPFALWICSAPDCAYSISKDATGDTYYKGVASTQEKEKRDKKWKEYEF